MCVCVYAYVRECMLVCVRVCVCEGMAHWSALLHVFLRHASYCVTNMCDQCMLVLLKFTCVPPCHARTFV